MAGLVPGGRQATPVMESRPVISTDTNGHVSAGQSPLVDKKEKPASKSLPRIDNVANHRDNSTYVNKSQTLDRKRNGKVHMPKFGKSLGNWFQKLVRHVSQNNHSLAGISGTFKKRSRSVDKTEKVSDGTSSGSVTPRSSEQYLKKLITENGKPPGIVGICNHGNTCFMNSVLQCLSNTTQLVEYFVADEYKEDLKKRGKSSLKKNGAKGEITEALAWLLKTMWTYKYTSSISRDFKCVIGKHGSQYQGCLQHDAQEFLLWLLDSIHEELRLESKKVIKKKVSSNDEESVPPPDRYASNTESKVYDLFQATYRSTLTCSSCRHQSNTFDPFLYLSLPIPQCNSLPVTVIVVYLDERPRQVRVAVMMNMRDTVKDLLAKLTKLSQVHEGQLMLIQTYASGFARTCQDTESLVDLTSADSLCALEMPLEKENKVSLSDHITLVVANVDVVGYNDRIRIGGYFVVRVPKNISYKELQSKLIQKMTSAVIDSETPADLETMEIPFQLRVTGVERDDSLLQSDLRMPLYSLAVSRAVNLCTSSGSAPVHVKLLAEWPLGSRQSILPDFTDLIEDHESVKTVQAQSEAAELFTLDECFQLYTQEEQLIGENAWLCPKCKSRQYGAVKSISLWSLPPVLVLHLKRFRQSGSLRAKVNTLVTFPVRGLNMRRYMVENGISDTHLANGKACSKSSSSSDEWTYDLYAVSNHYGNMQGGHYTACCRNAIDGQWYTFDDSQVTQVAESQTVTRSAYLLFYQKRNSSNQLPQSLIEKVCRLHGLSAADNGKECTDSSSQVSVPSSRNFIRGSSTYGTMPNIRRRANTAPNSGANTPSRVGSLPHASSADPLPNMGEVQLSANTNGMFHRRQLVHDRMHQTMSPPQSNHLETENSMNFENSVTSTMTSLVKSVEGSTKRAEQSVGKIPGGTAKATSTSPSSTSVGRAKSGSSGISRSKSGLTLAEQADGKKAAVMQESCV